MYIVNDGFKLIGANNRGKLLKALKIKLNEEIKTNQEADTIESNDSIDENIVDFKGPEEIKSLQPKSSNKTRFLKEIKDQIKPNSKFEKERDK